MVSQQAGMLCLSQIFCFFQDISEFGSRFSIPTLCYWGLFASLFICFVFLFVCSFVCECKGLLWFAQVQTIQFAIRDKKDVFYFEDTQITHSSQGPIVALLKNPRTSSGATCWNLKKQTLAFLSPNFKADPIVRREHHDESRPEM